MANDIQRKIWRLFHLLQSERYLAPDKMVRDQ